MACQWLQVRSKARQGMVAALETVQEDDGLSSAQDIGARLEEAAFQLAGTPSQSIYGPRMPMP